jgi:hypothetical protein
MYNINTHLTTYGQTKVQKQMPDLGKLTRPIAKNTLFLEF